MLICLFTCTWIGSYPICLYFVYNLLTWISAIWSHFSLFVWFMYSIMLHLSMMYLWTMIKLWKSGVYTLFFSGLYFIPVRSKLFAFEKSDHLYFSIWCSYIKCYIKSLDLYAIILVILVCMVTHSHLFQKFYLGILVCLFLSCWQLFACLLCCIANLA